MDTVLATLIQAPRYVTPAVALCLELEKKKMHQPEDILRHKSQIDAAVKQSQEEIRVLDAVLASLRDSAPVAATSVPAGF